MQLWCFSWCFSDSVVVSLLHLWRIRSTSSAPRLHPICARLLLLKCISGASLVDLGCICCTSQARLGYLSSASLTATSNGRQSKLWTCKLWTPKQSSKLRTECDKEMHLCCMVGAPQMVSGASLGEKRMMGLPIVDVRSKINVASRLHIWCIFGLFLVILGHQSEF